MGLVATGLVAVAAVVAAAAGRLPVVPPPDLYSAALLGSVVVMQLTYQFVLFVAIRSSSALLCAGGCVTVIPTGMVFDFLRRGIVPSAARLGGSALIIVGFVVLLCASSDAHDAQENASCCSSARSVPVQDTEQHPGAAAV